MSNQKIEVNVEPKEGLLIIREGKELALRDPNKIDIKGDLWAPKTFFDCRKEQFPVLTSYCHCTATTGNLTIQLVGDDVKVDRILVTGDGKSNPEMDMFTFGSGSHTIDQLVKILRRKRHLFPNPEAYQNLLNSLSNFKAKVDSTIASAKDAKGNVSQSLEKVVTTGVPESFIISVQPYLNGPVREVLVETEVTAGAESVTVALFAFSLEQVKRECALEVFGTMTDTIAGSGIPVIHNIEF